MSNQQRQVCFSGAVQGVGFRFTARRIADRHDVTGTVRTLHVGRVDSLVDGASSVIAAFLRELIRAMAPYIRSQRQNVAPYSGELDSFTIRF